MPRFARPKNKYGPIQGRGCRMYGKREKQPQTFHVPADAPCHVRPLGSKPWRRWVTRAAQDFVGYLWRNEGWYGFSKDGHELKIARSFVME